MTDASGVFRFEGLANVDYLLRASSTGADGLTRIFYKAVTVKDDAPTKVDLTMLGLSLKGTVRFIGLVGENVSVLLYRKTELSGVKTKRVTFSVPVKAGGFAVRGLQEGAYDVFVSYRIDGRHKSQKVRQDLVIRSGAENTVELDITPK